MGHEVAEQWESATRPIVSVMSRLFQKSYVLATSGRNLIDRALASMAGLSVQQNLRAAAFTAFAEVQMFFRATRLRLREWKQSRLELARKRREESIRRWQARLEETKRLIHRAAVLTAGAIAVATFCGFAAFVVGAFSAGRQAYSVLSQMSVPAVISSSPKSFVPVASITILPDGGKTPGEVDDDVTLDVLRRRITSQYRVVSMATSECAWNAYGIARSERSGYRLDHLIPIELGGASDSCRNVWPQPIAEAARKDHLESVLNKLVRDGRMNLAEAQRAIATNWIAAYAKYVASVDGSDEVDKPVYTAFRVADQPTPQSSSVAQSVSFTCGDGSSSHSSRRRGACSHHGGIR